MTVIGLPTPLFGTLSAGLVASAYALSIYGLETYEGIAAALVFWTTAYTFFAKILETGLPGGMDDIEGYTRGVYYVSVFHQFVICPAFFFAILGHLPSVIFAYFEPPAYFSVFPIHSQVDLLLKHTQFAIVGYEFKDFFICNLDFGFIVHHVFTFFGCFLCAYCPEGSVNNAMMAIFAEVGSGFYSFYICVNKNKLAAIAYIFAMNMSNITCAYMIYLNYIYGTIYIYRIAFVMLAVGLIGLRSGGVVLCIMDICRHSSSSTKFKAF